MKKRSCRYVSFITAAALMSAMPFSAHAEEVVTLPDEVVATEESIATEEETVSESEIADEDSLCGFEPFEDDDREAESVLENMSDTSVYLSEELPSSYPDDVTALPALRKQYHGTCWAYSAIAAAEMDLFTDGTVGKNVDLSEMHTAYFTKFFNNDTVDSLELTIGDKSHSNQTDYLEAGGNYIRAFHTMATWSGLAGQKDVTDEQKATKNTKLKAKDQYGISKYHLQGMYEIVKKDRDLVKENIIKHGAVAASYHSDRKYYTSTTNGYYCPTDLKVNHGITIVGWDDNFKKEDFTQSSSTPAGDGAWLVRNSWTSGGYKNAYEGYYWMSYYDKSLSDYFYAVDVEKGDNYNHNYQYDGGNYHSTYLYMSGQDSAANVFTVSANKEGNIEELKAVAFATYESQNVDYKADVYVNLSDENDPTSGTLADSITGNILYTGYYTVSTNKPIKLIPGTKFSVVVTLKENADTVKTPIFAYERAVTTSGTYGSEEYTVSMQRAQSFVHVPASYYGTDKWHDMSVYAAGHNAGNVRIKAFTNDTDEAPVMPESVALNKHEISLYVDDTAKLEATVSPDDATYNNVIFKSNDESVVSVDGDGNVKAMRAGTATIFAYDAFMDKYDTCNVSVTRKPLPIDDPSDDRPESPRKDIPGTTPSGNGSVSYDKLPDYGSVSGNFMLAYTKFDVSKLLKGTGAKARFKSSNKKVAKVNRRGIVTGKATGDVIITLEEKIGRGWKAVSSCSIYVEKPDMPRKMDVMIGSEFPAQDLLVGASFYPNQWISTKPNVAKVDEYGVVKVLSKGKTKIYAVYTTSQGSTGKRYKTTLRAR